MRHSLLALSVAGAAAVFSHNVFAADLPMKAPPHMPVAVTDAWSGFYVGLTAGYGFGHAPTDITPNAAETGIGVGDPTFGPLPGGPRTSGFVGGGETGYNWRFNNVVAGLEADLSYSGVKGSNSATGALFIGGIFNTTAEAKSHWFGTVRGRLGFLANRDLLIYGTGGLAYGDAETTVTGTNLAAACPFNNCYSGSTKATAGWTAGAGAEYAFMPKWTVKAEYLYLDFGHRSFVITDSFTAGGMLAVSTHQTVNVVRAGLNYHF